MTNTTEQQWRDMAAGISATLGLWINEMYWVAKNPSGELLYIGESWKDVCMFLMTCDVVKAYTQKHGWN